MPERFSAGGENFSLWSVPEGWNVYSKDGRDPVFFKNSVNKERLKAMVEAMVEDEEWQEDEREELREGVFQALSEEQRIG